MCRILIMDDSELRTLSDKARMYLNLLGLDAQLDITTTTEDACYHLYPLQYCSQPDGGKRFPVAAFDSPAFHR